jgi:hypothetical protein
MDRGGVEESSRDVGGGNDMILKDMDWLMEVMAEGIRNAPNVNSNTQARAVLDAMEAAGVVTVPMEATEEMLWKGNLKGNAAFRMGYPMLNAATAASPYRRKE